MKVTEVMGNLFEEIQKKDSTLNDAKYTKKNYIQFNIPSSYGIHFELWLKKDIMHIDLHQENKTKEVNEGFFRCLESIVQENSSQFVIQKRGSGSSKILRQIKTYGKDEILNRVDEIIEDVISMRNIFEAQVKVCIENIKNKKNDKSQGNEVPRNKQVQPLNQILYGPPGTGKTYNTINKALEIILETQQDTEIKQILDKSKYNNLNKEERKKLTDKFKKVQENEQIEFVTFHQSYGYEEFVEGIKAIPAGEEGNNSKEMIYAVVDGIFKKLSDKAKGNYQKSNIESLDEIKKNNEFNCKLELLKEAIRIKNEKNEKYYINDTAYILSVDENYFRYTGDNWEAAPRNMHYKDLEKMYIDNIQNRQETVKNEKLSGLARQHATYFFKLFEKLKKQECKEKNINNSKKNLESYILIIDEINRGNISKIFGELITLIEPSKRIGEDEAIVLKLPNSKDPFGVPKNLYIIGTMNTADRSIAQIDTALRRRFVFEEMMPKSNLLVFNNDEDEPLIIKDGDKEINVQEILNAINERIEYIYDREHTIGHSYFMPLIKEPTKAKLDEIFNVEIIPLLAEYFYGDWGDIKIILNDTKDKGYFIKDKTKELKYKPKMDRQNKVYSISEEFSAPGYLNIYDGLSKDEDSDTGNND